MTTGRFERSEDGTTWEAIELQAMSRNLRGTFRNVDIVVNSMLSAPLLNVVAMFAVYRFNPDGVGSLRDGS